MAKTYEENAVKALKTGWENYHQFCLDFVGKDREKKEGGWLTTEIQELVEKSFEPQIVKLQMLTVAAYKSIEPLIIAGYSLNEMLELVRWFSKSPSCFRFGGDKPIIIKKIINGLDAVLTVAIKPTRAEIEALIKSLMAWQNEQPEFTTGIDPDEDRTLNPVDRLRFARLVEQAEFFLQGSADHKNLFQDLIAAYSKNTIPAMLGIITKLLNPLCEIRNTLPRIGGKTGVENLTDTEQNGRKADWNDPAYITNSDAVKIADNRISLQTLSKLLKSGKENIRYIKRGSRCKVHNQDFKEYLKKLKPNIFTDEVIEGYLANTKKTQEQIRQEKTK